MSWRNETHLNFVRAQPCCACSAPGPSDPHHFAGAKGTALKASDAMTVPLCRTCHDYWHRHGCWPPMNRAESMALMWRTCAMILAARIQQM